MGLEKINRMKNFPIFFALFVYLINCFRKSLNILLCRMLGDFVKHFIKKQIKQFDKTLIFAYDLFEMIT